MAYDQGVREPIFLNICCSSTMQYCLLMCGNLFFLRKEYVSLFFSLASELYLNFKFTYVVDNLCYTYLTQF
jgi:hypothetical protein